LTDVNEQIINECSECMFPHVNIRDWFARSHPSEGENRTGNRGETYKCKRASTVYNS
jgi:hypothetical protein